MQKYLTSYVSAECSCTAATVMARSVMKLWAWSSTEPPCAQPSAPRHGHASAGVVRPRFLRRPTRRRPASHSWLLAAPSSIPGGWRLRVAAKLGLGRWDQERLVVWGGYNFR